MHNSIKPKKIAAAVIEQGDKILIAQRSNKNDGLENKWEFPGGKQEPGETLQECLKRELYEEFGIVAKVGEYITCSAFTHKNTYFEMEVFKVPSFTGTITLFEHKEIRWITRKELPNFDYPQPDLPIVELLMKENPSL